LFDVASGHSGKKRTFQTNDHRFIAPALRVAVARFAAEETHEERLKRVAMKSWPILRAMYGLPNFLTVSTVLQRRTETGSNEE
jgi:hypothetical protein